MTRPVSVLVLAAALLVGCEGASGNAEPTCPGPDCPGCPGPDCAPQGDGKADTTVYGSANPAAGGRVLYEIQVRAANACDPTLGADWQREACLAKVAPTIPYRAEGMTCQDLPALERIRLGTLDDLTEPTTDYREGITLAYVHERVGANTVWLMPLFPNNDSWSIPDACDNLGSPYAVRDYVHARGTLSRACIAKERDEYSEQPCWGDAALDDVIAEAHRLGLKVMLDVAFNHFGHNYLLYDYVDQTPIRQRLAEGDDLDDLWDFDADYDPRLLHPEILDTPSELDALIDEDEVARADHGTLLARCPDLSGDALVRAFGMWRVALDWERAQFPCDQFLDSTLPGFYLGSNRYDPATSPSSTFTNNWRDVKFLFHHGENAAHQHEFARQREYLFHVLNYWVSRGVDGFRLDHATDPDGGMAPNEWKYLLWKTNFYAEKRGQARPVYLAEEFGDQMGMAEVVDVLTEGYVFDMNGRGGKTKDAAHVESVLTNMDRFDGKVYVMTALETHDEHRLIDGTGFDRWTGAGFWGIGATTWSTPMLLMGQEFGESWGLGFRKSDLLRSRFEGTDQFFAFGDALVEYYHSLIRARLDGRNRALLASPRAFLRTRDGNARDKRIFAEVKWSGDGNVVFALHNLWAQDVAQSYYLPDDLKASLWLKDDRSYRLVDVLAGRTVHDCTRGADLAWDFYVSMSADTRAQWLRLEACD
jgi:glycosidase